MALLVVVYFGWVQATSHADHLSQLAQARDHCASATVVEYLSRREDFTTWLGTAPGNFRAFSWLEEHASYASMSRWDPSDSPALLQQLPWVRSLTIRPVDWSSGGFAWFATLPPRGVYLDVRVDEYGREWSAEARLDFEKDWRTGPIDALRSSLLEAGLDVDDDEAFGSMYWRLQRELISRDVVLPGSGLSFRVGRVVWVSVAAAMFILVVMRDRIRHVLGEPELGGETPWLILDADAGVAARVAQLWMVALFVGPWLQGIAALRMAVFEIKIDPPVESAPLNVVVFASLAAAVCAMSWVSVATILELVRLRRLRSPTASP